MDFTLVSGDESRHYSGAAAYRFDRYGLLVVTDGAGKQYTYSPAAWSFIEEDERGSGIGA